MPNQNITKQANKVELRNLCLIGIVATLFVLSLFQPDPCYAQQPKQLKIGAILNLTGYGADFGENSRKGLTLAQEEINSSGGVDGLPLEIIYEDSQSIDLEAVASAAQKLVNVDRVDILITQWSADTDVAWPIASRYGVPTLTVSAGAPNFINGRPLLIRSWGDDRALVECIASKIEASKFSRPIVLTTQDSYFIALKQELEKSLKDRGIDPIESWEVQPGTSDFRSEAFRIKTLHADVVISQLYYPQQADLLRQLRVIKKNVAVFGTLGSDGQSFLELAGDAANGLFLPTYLTQDDKFIQSFEKRWGTRPWLSADTAYDSLYIIAEAARRTNNRESFFKALTNIRRFAGASGELSIMSNGERPARQAVLTQLVDGVAKQISEPGDCLRSIAQ